MDTGLVPKVSVLLMVYNEERQIRACLETVKWADEIVVCDSFSTDSTVAICREYTDRIYQRKFDNFGDHKAWTLDKPSHEWVFFMEADERMSCALREEIRERLARRECCDGYWIPYENFFFGRRLRGRFWQTRRIKLYRKEKGSWEKKLVHVNFILRGEAGLLQNPLHHYPYQTLSHWLRKFDYNTSFMAEERLRRGERVSGCGVLRVLAGIPRMFYLFYVDRQDYKSGWAGLAVSLLATFNEPVAYAKFFAGRCLCARR